ncbi:MAG: TIM-barrel domain-containing protein [Terriglobales bacterium]
MTRRQLGKGLTVGLALTQVPTGSATQKLAQPEAEAMPWQEIHPGVWKTTLGTPEAFTPVRSRLVPPARQGFHSLPAAPAPPIGALNGKVTERGFLIRLPLQPDEMVYGFGLQLLSFAQRGKKKTIRVNADPKLDTGDSHAPVPFYVTTRGYGILIDSARHVDFYCGDARSKPTHPEVPGATPDPAATRSLALQDAGEVTVEVPRARGADVYLFGGPTTLQAVQRYNLFAGGGVLPPQWGLGFWYRADGHSTQQAVMQLAREFRERKIPCDVLGLEPGWQSHAYSCSFAWDGDRFPEPAALLRDLDSLQFKANLWEHAFTHPSSPLFSPLLPHSGNYGVWGGLVPDFAAAPARDLFGGYHGRNLIDAGVAGFKLDECDGSDFTGGWSFPDMSCFPSGVDGEQMHAVFGLRYQHTLWQQFQSRSRPTYGLVRSSGALATPYPFVLYSDLYDHRQFIRGIVNAGFSGLLWCPEVRDAKNEEDLIRRLQTVVFSPLAMINAWYIKNPPWKQIDRRENNAGRLADNWEALEARCREIIGWRMQLVPYLLSAFAQYASDGTPPFRALILDDPSDQNLLLVDDEYMIGDRMLVAPLIAGEPSRNVVLPRGAWHDFWTGAAIAGGTTLTVAGDTEKIPVFVKAGSVLPVAGVGASSASPESSLLTVRVYGDGALPWRLAGPSGPQLELRWNAAKRQGSLQQPASSGSRYSVARWQPMG